MKKIEVIMYDTREDILKDLEKDCIKEFIKMISKSRNKREPSVNFNYWEDDTGNTLAGRHVPDSNSEIKNLYYLYSDKFKDCYNNSHLGYDPDCNFERCCVWAYIAAKAKALLYDFRFMFFEYENNTYKDYKFNVLGLKKHIKKCLKERIKQ